MIRFLLWAMTGGLLVKLGDLGGAISVKVGRSRTPVPQ